MTRNSAGIGRGEEMAARLTPTQWDAPGHLEHIGKPWRFPVRWSVLVGYSLERLGLARRTFWLDKTYLTPLGKVALRARQPQQAKD